ncbi:hypothetical protein LTR81_027955 [Elasticomyces elasticus]
MSEQAVAVNIELTAKTLIPSCGMKRQPNDYGLGSPASARTRTATMSFDERTGFAETMADGSSAADPPFL